MKTENEIREQISKIEKDYHHVLTGSFADLFSNSPRAVMQVAGTSLLDGLYFALGEKRPEYEFERGRR